MSSAMPLLHFTSLMALCPAGYMGSVCLPEARQENITEKIETAIKRSSRKGSRKPREARGAAAYSSETIKIRQIQREIWAANTRNPQNDASGGAKTSRRQLHSDQLVNLSFSQSRALCHSAKGAAFYPRLFQHHVTALCKCGIPPLFFNDTIIVSGMFYFIFSKCRPSLIPREGRRL